jgi:hypothetical protein
LEGLSTIPTFFANGLNNRIEAKVIKKEIRKTKINFEIIKQLLHKFDGKYLLSCHYQTCYGFTRINNSISQATKENLKP